jgi:hypothetical protein
MDKIRENEETREIMEVGEIGETLAGTKGPF